MLVTVEEANSENPKKNPWDKGRTTKRINPH